MTTDGNAGVATDGDAGVAPDGDAGVTTNPEARQWAMILHLSMLSGFVIPFAGLIAPILIWQLKKEELPEIDIHGKNATNWIISSVIYFVVGGILMLVFVGILVVLAVAVCAVVFPIIAGIKANNGEVWEYPLTIKFLK